jgi:hypothetical protein
VLEVIGVLLDYPDRLVHQVRKVWLVHQVRRVMWVLLAIQALLVHG